MLFRSVQDLKGQVIKHFYPYYNGHELSATKCRNSLTKDFFVSGSYNETGLFGQQLFKGGKYVTITEGECDAMAAYELLGSKWAVVSIKRGAQGAVKDIKESLEFFEEFENVIIAFDNDKAGQEASDKDARLFKDSSGVSYSGTPAKVREGEEVDVGRFSSLTGMRGSKVSLSLSKELAKDTTSSSALGRSKPEARPLLNVMPLAIIVLSVRL